MCVLIPLCGDLHNYSSSFVQNDDLLHIFAVTISPFQEGITGPEWCSTVDHFDMSQTVFESSRDGPTWFHHPVPSPDAVS